MTPPPDLPAKGGPIPSELIRSGGGVIATITVNPSIDQHILVENLVKDDANRARSIFSDPGGKGLNVSKVVKELGGKSYAYALVGGLSGELWKDLVKKARIPFMAVPVKGETRINTILTDLKDHTQTRISAPGPFIPHTRVKALVRKLLQHAPKPFLWALGGSLASRMPASTYKEIVIALQKEGVPCILDADNDALRVGIEAKPFMIKPNEYEMQRLTNLDLRTIPDYLKAAKSLVMKGITIVVISLGRHGALFVTRGDAFHVTTPAVPVRSKVGAGDSLIGGFALGLCRKMSLREAARLGVAAGTSAVMTEGTKLCRKKDIPELLPKIKIRSVNRQRASA